jgi:hypothetical protein
MEKALSAAKKNRTREKVQRLRAALGELLAANAAAPAAERLPRDALAVDFGARDAIAAEGARRVVQTKEAIVRENLGKDLAVQRIRAVAVDSMVVLAAELHGLLAAVSVHNFPLRRVRDDDARALERVSLLLLPAFKFA